MDAVAHGIWRTRRLGELLEYEQPGPYLVHSTDYGQWGKYPVLTAGKTFVLGFTNEVDGVYTRHPVVIFDDFTTASKYVDFDFKAKSSAMKMLTARRGEADLRFVYERMQLIDYPILDHKRRWIAEYSKLEIQVPELDEQRAIARVARDLAIQIELLERLLSKKRSMKIGMMQELLSGSTRLPGFRGEWTSAQAGGLGAFKGGSGFPLRFQGSAGGAIPFYKVSDMNNDGNELYMRRANNYVSERQRKQIGATLIAKRAIVFAKVGAAVFLERKRILTRPSCIDNNMAAFTVDESRVDVRFMHYVLSNFQLGSLVATGALPSLNGRQLRSIPVSLPMELDEQRAIAKVLDDADTEIDCIVRRLKKAEEIRTGIMQQLLQGRVRLPMGDAS